MKAFKDWSYVVNALGSGRQSIILRKGGIHEEGGEFSLDAEEFVLFPTLFHTEGDKVKPEFANGFDEEMYQPDQFTVEIKFASKVVGYTEISDEKLLDQIYEYHIWSKELVQERFTRWSPNKVYCLLLRTYELQSPLSIELTPEMGGCKSWIDVGSDEIAFGNPVLSDSEFEKTRVVIESIIS